MGDNEILNVLKRDLPEPFVASLQNALLWAYANTYDDLARPPGGFIVPRPNDEWDPVDLRTARSARRGNGMRA